MSRVFEALRRSETDQIAQAVVGDLTAVPPANKVATVEVRPADAVRITPELENVAILRLNPSPEDRLVALTEITSLGSEKFSLLALRLSHIQQQRGLRTVVITSTGPEEGKSLVSANLAIALARQPRQRVLLIEGDIRKPTLAKRLGLRAGLGLTDYLRQKEQNIATILRRLENLPVWLLPSGATPDDPIETLQSPKVAEVLGDLVDSFTCIIVDSPPIIPLADTSIWARAADGILFVIREGKTSKQQLEQAVASLDQSKLIGIVFNDSHFSEHHQYYRYGYGYKRKKDSSS